MSDSIGSGPAEDGERMRSGKLYLGKTERAYLAMFKRIWRILAAVITVRLQSFTDRVPTHGCVR